MSARTCRRKRIQMKQDVRYIKRARRDPVAQAAKERRKLEEAKIRANRRFNNK
jgi:hypothetical protein